MLRSCSQPFVYKQVVRKFLRSALLLCASQKSLSNVSKLLSRMCEIVGYDGSEYSYQHYSLRGCDSMYLGGGCCLH